MKRKQLLICVILMAFFLISCTIQEEDEVYFDSKTAKEILQESTYQQDRIYQGVVTLENEMDKDLVFAQFYVIYDSINELYQSTGVLVTESILFNTRMELTHLLNQEGLYIQRINTINQGTPLELRFFYGKESSAFEQQTLSLLPVVMPKIEDLDLDELEVTIKEINGERVTVQIIMSYAEYVQTNPGFFDLFLDPNTQVSLSFIITKHYEIEYIVLSLENAHITNQDDALVMWLRVQVDFFHEAYDFIDPIDLGTYILVP